MDDPLDSTRETRRYRLSLAHCHPSPFIRRTTRDIPRSDAFACCRARFSESRNFNFFGFRNECSIIVRMMRSPMSGD